MAHGPMTKMTPAAVDARRAPAPCNGPDDSPERYIKRISLVTGREIRGPIDPEELLVQSHRDRHPADVIVQFLASRMVQLTGDERAAWRGMRQLNRLGRRAAELVGAVTGSRAVEKEAKRLIGVTDSQYFFRFREPTPLSAEEVVARLARLRRTGARQLRRSGRQPRLHVLVTGGTGFLGKQILARAAADPRIGRVVCLLRPETARDPQTGTCRVVRSAQQRGVRLLRRLRISGRAARKFRFVAGDIEKPNLGMAPAEAARLRTALTHVVHCAASVSFDAPYAEAFRANVIGSRNALDFSLRCQRARGSAFVCHVAIETSYIHGRTKPAMAQESALVFPRNFYNNYYELTKALASIDTDHYLIERGLRVVQLLPSIIIGAARTGNNGGDTKVVNAPVNAFGRAKEVIERMGTGLASKPKAWLLAQMAESFPGDPSAELNLVPVDRVVAGVMAALTVPEAIGARVHLATDDRIRSAAIARIAKEEIGVDVRFADPTLFRTLSLPMRTRTLQTLNQPQLAKAVSKLAQTFGGYGEWGQPIHDVGNDVRILGLPIQRPHTEHAFRMLCRHNCYVQGFGKIRDADEIARREAIWEQVIDRIEYQTGREAACIPAAEFRAQLAHHLDLPSLTWRRT
jgi:nucleoside-diphosphate-sugar epimerase